MINHSAIFVLFFHFMCAVAASQGLGTESENSNKNRLKTLEEAFDSREPHLTHAERLSKVLEKSNYITETVNSLKADLAASHSTCGCSSGPIPTLVRSLCGIKIFILKPKAEHSIGTGYHGRPYIALRYSDICPPCPPAASGAGYVEGVILHEAGHTGQRGRPGDAARLWREYDPGSFMISRDPAGSRPDHLLGGRRESGDRRRIHRG